MITTRTTGGAGEPLQRQLGQIVALVAALLMPGQALAHASEGGFVLLLPTDAYIAGGVASVLATVVLIALIPEGAARRLFRTRDLGRAGPPRGVEVTSALSALLLLWAISQGFAGPQDPVKNPLPLLVWTGFWLFLVAGCGVFGDLWRWLSPFRATLGLMRLFGLRPLLRYPARWGYWPAGLSYLAFAGVLMVHIAPTDPDRLAWMVLAYWGVTALGSALFGARWLLRGEGLGVLMHLYAQLAPLRRRGGRWRLGLPGWDLDQRRAPSVSLAIFMLMSLALGSFDGLNETFRWFGWIGMNPLEFTGRSAVVGANLTGLILCGPLLVLLYAASVKAGLILVEAGGFGASFRVLAPAILPIAFGYHAAHYLPAALVEGQYLWNMVAHHLGLREVTVSTGFFNRQASVRVIWLSQAAAVVLGHVLAIVMSHVAALRLHGSHGRAALSQAPLALFMIFYTLFGLWLLASPRGA
ncbi:hypothetical protein [Pseudooceanicola marinus]|uniref:hypothetical protein n=1 Tax=Pseudooceanicola marinus TaxID=396013 RepID=UPI001CD56C85|nr:hypothetical protein [Pseudooceanicola marinus]MCA1336938.1 hypothetical protein [Pseudooceanicola marinus]